MLIHFIRIKDSQLTMVSIADRLKGAAGGVMASVTGDKESQESYQLQHDTGKTAQRSAESDIQKQAKA